MLTVGIRWSYMMLSASAGIVSVDYQQVSYPCTFWSFLQWKLHQGAVGSATVPTKDGS